MSEPRSLLYCYLRVANPNDFLPLLFHLALQRPLYALIPHVREALGRTLQRQRGGKNTLSLILRVFIALEVPTDRHLFWLIFHETNLYTLRYLPSDDALRVDLWHYVYIRCLAHL